MKKKYFPNNWRAIKDSPDKYFPSMPYEQLEDWKVYGYEIPASVFGLVRTKDKNGKKMQGLALSSNFASFIR